MLGIGISLIFFEDSSFLFIRRFVIEYIYWTDFCVCFGVELVLISRYVIV